MKSGSCQGRLTKLSKAPKKFHIAYEFDGDKFSIGETVTTLCGKERKVHEPDISVPICGKCFDLFSEDSRRTGTANEILMEVVQGLADVLNTGRTRYLNEVAGGILIGGGDLDRETARVG